MDREDRVLMIVRAGSGATSPRHSNASSSSVPAPSPREVATLLGDARAPLHVHVRDRDRDRPSLQDADWRQQQFQRQRMQLLSMAIFLCFLVLFFDHRTADQRQMQARRPHVSNNNVNNGHRGNKNYYYQRFQDEFDYENDTERVARVDALLEVLHREKGYDGEAEASNVSGIYSGGWQSLEAEDYKKMQPTRGDIVPYLKVDRDIQMQQYTQPIESGHTWLLLKMKPPASLELKDDVSYVTGQIVLYEDQATLAATILPVQGVFLRKLGKLTLFGNSPDATVQLLYRRKNGTTAAPLTTTAATQNNDPNESDDLFDGFMPHLRLSNGMSIGILDGIPIIENRTDYDSVDISPPRYSYVSRFRNSDSFSDQCVSVVDMDLIQPSTIPSTTTVQDPTASAQPQLLKAKLSGTLASVNCGLYLKIETLFQEENLNNFFSKASHYAVLMTFLSMAEIYFLLRQLQTTNTQATAAKVSLMTVGQQAILDSYLCLGHLTVGIVAQNIFSAFASVAFVKLIIFSVFEMRYLLIIWKARRPQGFTEGWITLRRELTTLYSRFYLSLLGGLAIIYNFSNFMPFMVFICYSFWVPQIIHNVHYEVRNPFDLGYLYGISALRMFLPLYFYGYADNFLSAFPMYENKPNLSFCYVLTAWMLAQVGTLLLQQRFGPRFFIPARFLPVKYNYERRVNLQELSLLRAAADEDGKIDCVICMVDIDLDARDYMIAPCDHIFHRECLHGWMQVKMECPTCRSQLPEP